MKTQFSQKMSGERKAVMEAIAAMLGAQVNYTRAPRFAYEAGGWSIDRGHFGGYCARLLFVGGQPAKYFRRKSAGVRMKSSAG